MFEFNSDDVGNSNSGGVDGSVLIPHRFFWPHGGRNIFLCGSFTGWSERIPMSPMEGHPTIFQGICNLTPGCHQYKFNVDGEWRYDEHQDFVSGSYGVVNTVSLARETDMIPSANASSLGGVHMEVDYHAHLAPPSDGRMLYLITEADLRVACQRISIFLTQHTAYELLPESGKVVALDVTLPVKQAFHILYEQGVPVAPLWDSGKGHFVGVVSAIDFILILRELGNHGSNLTEEELETHTILAWKDGKVRRSKQIDGHDGIRIPFLKPLINAGPYDSLKDVALKILQNKVSMVPIIHSSSPDGSFPQLLHLASLSGILKCICRHYRHSRTSLPILQQPIFSIPLGTWVPKIGDPSQPPFAMLRPSALLGDALSLFVEANVSSIPIVDENDSLLDIYSRSDITSLAKDRAYEQIRMDEITIYQALQLRQDANSPCGVFDGQRCQMCLRTDPLYKVMEKLSNPGVRRLVIVEAGSKRVEGIITLSDVFRFLLG